MMFLALQTAVFGFNMGLLGIMYATLRRIRAERKRAEEVAEEHHRENMLYQAALFQLDHGDHQHVVYQLNGRTLATAVGSPLFLDALGELAMKHELADTKVAQSCDAEDEQ